MKRIIPAIIVVIGILVLFGSLWLLLEPRLAREQAADALPAQIAGLSLTRKTTGEQAISQVSDMHGKEFPILWASIGYYGSPQITVWVAGADSSSTAADMVTVMEARIAEGNSPFTPLQQFREGDRDVFVLEGMGQRHYYFQSKKLVIWLASAPELADQSIREILEVYP